MSNRKEKELKDNGRSVSGIPRRRRENDWGRGEHGAGGRGRSGGSGRVRPLAGGSSRGLARPRPLPLGSLYIHNIYISISSHYVLPTKHPFYNLTILPRYGGIFIRCGHEVPHLTLFFVCSSFLLCQPFFLPSVSAFLRGSDARGTNDRTTARFSRYIRLILNEAKTMVRTESGRHRHGKPIVGARS